MNDDTKTDAASLRRRIQTACFAIALVVVGTTASAAVMSGRFSDDPLALLVDGLGLALLLLLSRGLG